MESSAVCFSPGALALLSAIALPFLLPKMLERYFFLADILSLVVAISFRTRRAMLIAAAVQIASLLTLLTYMYFYRWPYLTLVGAIMSAAALAMTFTAARQNGARWPSLWRRRARPELTSAATPGLSTDPRRPATVG